MTDSIFDGEDTIVGLVWIVTEIAAINWALVEFFDVNLVTSVVTPGTTGATIAFGLIGVAGVIALLDSLGIYDAAEVLDRS